MSDTYQSTAGSRLLDNVWEGVKGGALVGSVLPVAGTLAGAIGGGLAGVGKSVWDKIDENDDRDEFRRLMDRDAMIADYVSRGLDADRAQLEVDGALEEEFYSHREGERADNPGLLDQLFSPWF